MNDLDLAYIAGFFDGEGSASLLQVRDRHGKRRPRLEARLSQNNSEVLYWIKDLFGFGNVYAKVDNRTPNVNHCYAVTWLSARKFLTAIEPYLKVKKNHVTALLDQTGRENMLV